MSKPVPSHISRKYKQGAHGFRAEKRRQGMALDKALDDLRFGCAFFPCGSEPIEKIDELIAVIRQSISVKNWGR